MTRPQEPDVGIWTSEQDGVDANNVIVHVDQFTFRVKQVMQGIEEFRGSMPFQFIDEAEGESGAPTPLYSHWKKNPDAAWTDFLRILNITGNSVNLILSGVAAAKFPILRLLQENPEAMKRLHRIILLSCENESKLRNALGDLLPKNAAYVWYDNEAYAEPWAWSDDVDIDDLIRKILGFPEVKRFSK